MKTPAIIAIAAVASAAILSGGGVTAVAMSHHTAPVAAVKAVPVPTKTIIIKRTKVIHRTKIVPAAPAPQAAAPADVSGDGSPGAIAENTVLAYYGDLNAKDFTDAWNIGGSNLNGGSGYAAWVHGYDTTANIDVGAYSWNGAAVETTIVATQTDGSVKTYAGTYTVENGAITSANMTQTG